MKNKTIFTEQKLDSLALSLFSLFLYIYHLSA